MDGPTGSPVEAISIATSTPTYLTFLPDAQTWVATNEAGDLVSFTGYDAFGTLAFGVPATPFGFSGQYTDPTTGFTNLRARFYDSSTGAFTTWDPAFSLTGTAYTYAGNDPVNGSDPTGLLSISIPGLNQFGQQLVAFADTTRHLGASAVDYLPNQIIAAGYNVYHAYNVLYNDGRNGCGWQQAAMDTGPAILADVELGSFAGGGEGEGIEAGIEAAQRMADPGSMAGVRAAGMLGEQAAGIIKNTDQIPSLSGTAAYRIPDELTSSVIGEVKNVSYLSYTSQLRDFAAYAQQQGLTFSLYVRSSTRLSAPLQSAVDAGDINLVRKLPG